MNPLSSQLGLSDCVLFLGGVRFEALVERGEQGDLEDLLRIGEGVLFLFIFRQLKKDLQPFVSKLIFFVCGKKFSQ